jgi:hypothetical protein
MAETKQEISQDEPFKIGDLIEMTFKIPGSANWAWLRAAALYTIEARLKDKYPNLVIKNWSNKEEGITIRFEVVEQSAFQQIAQASVATGAIVAAAIIGGGLFVYLSLDKLYKISQTPAGKIAMAGAGSLGIGVLILVLVFIFGKFKAQ